MRAVAVEPRDQTGRAPYRTRRRHSPMLSWYRRPVRCAGQASVGCAVSCLAGHMPSTRRVSSAICWVSPVATTKTGTPLTGRSMRRRPSRHQIVQFGDEQPASYTENSQGRADLLAYLGLVLADLPGEDQRVQPVQRGGRRGDAPAAAECERRQRQRGRGITLLAGAHQVPGVSRGTGEAEQTGMPVECVIQFVRAQTVPPLQPQQRAGVEAAAAPNHHQAFPRSEAHGGFHAASVPDGAGRAAAAQVDEYDLEVVDGSAQGLRRPLQCPRVGKPVEAVPAQPVFGSPSLRHGVRARRCRQILVKDSVEAGDVRNVGGAEAGSRERWRVPSCPGRAGHCPISGTLMMPTMMHTAMPDDTGVAETRRSRFPGCLPGSCGGEGMR